MKYKLKLDYTADELEELKTLGKDYDSPINAIDQIVESGTGDDPLKNLGAKYSAIGYEDEFNFVEDINNVVMGTAIFPENKYVVHDSVTDRYIYYSMITSGLCWRQLQAGIPEIKTKDEWLAISPAYGLMLERVEE